MRSNGCRCTLKLLKQSSDKHSCSEMRYSAVSRGRRFSAAMILAFQSFHLLVLLCAIIFVIEVHHLGLDPNPIRIISVRVACSATSAFIWCGIRSIRVCHPFTFFVSQTIYLLLFAWQMASTLDALVYFERVTQAKLCLFQCSQRVWRQCVIFTFRSSTASPNSSHQLDGICLREAISLFAREFSSLVIRE